MVGDIVQTFPLVPSQFLIALWRGLQGGVFKALGLGQGPFCPGLRHATSMKPSGILTSYHLESLPTMNSTSSATFLYELC